jgi:hypothetical protein
LTSVELGTAVAQGGRNPMMRFQRWGLRSGPTTLLPALNHLE